MGNEKKDTNSKKKDLIVNIEKYEKPVEDMERTAENRVQGKQKALYLTKVWAKRWFITAFSGMALGLFVTLIAGLILKQIGTIFTDGSSIRIALVNMGTIAMYLTGAGIGGGVAHSLKANPLVIFACMVAGMLGANAAAFIDGNLFQQVTLASGAVKTIPVFAFGEPIGAYVAAIISCEVGILLTGKTKLDIVVLPLSVMIVAVIVTYILCPSIITAIKALADAIFRATELQPFGMGIILAVVIGVLLTMPTSSAAICISLGLGGIAGGAAVVGCCSHMVGFAVMSFRENKWGGLIAQGLGTSMIQIPNVMKKPILLVPPIIASAIVGPLATVVFKLQCGFAGSGMGTAGLVGVLETIKASKDILSTSTLVLAVILLMFVLPAVITLFVSEFMRKKGYIDFGDLALENK